jgi:hypothetical protein
LYSIVAQRNDFLAQREQHAAEAAIHSEALTSRANEIAHLQLLVEKLKRMLFGAKSEKVLRQIEQLELKLEELESEKLRRRQESRVTQ